MPSGAKKRRAARRKKEHEQQLRTGGLSPTAFPGNLEMEDDDLSSQDGRGSESSSSELPSPIAWDEHRHHLGIEETEMQIKSEIEEPEMQIKSEIEEPEMPIKSDIKETKIIQRIEIAGNGERKEHLVPQNGKDEIKVDEALPPLSSPAPNSPKSVEIPASNFESENLEHEPEKVECSVPISEHAVQAGSALDARSEMREIGTEMPLSNLCHEPPRDIEVKEQSTQLERRTSWMSCCGLFDAVIGGNKKRSERSPTMRGFNAVLLWQTV